MHRIRYLRLAISTRFKITSDGHPILGAHIKVLSGASINLGKNVALGRGLYIEPDLDVGDDTLISGSVALVGNVHPLDEPTTVFTTIDRSDQKIVMDGDNLVGYGAILIAPCHLKRGAVVGAGAVATGTLDEDVIVVGVPARPLRKRRR